MLGVRVVGTVPVVSAADDRYEEEHGRHKRLVERQRLTVLRTEGGGGGGRKAVSER